jgi:hypothetical protein
MPQVPTSQVEKNVKFQAAYTSLTFNKKNFAFYRIDGVLEGMDIVPGGAGLLKATAGAFIQRGIIVELLTEFSFAVPAFAFPWTIYATTDDEVPASPTTIDVAPSGSEPAGVVILATTEDGDTFDLPKKISIKELCLKIEDLENERKIRRNFLCNAGFELLNPFKGTDFIFPGSAMDCWQADNLSDKAPGSKLSVIADSVQTVRGGAAVQMDSEAYLDPGGVQPDLSVLPARVRSNARIYQSIEGYECLIGEPITIAVSLRLPPGQTEQLHDLEVAVYGSSIGTPGFSDGPVDKFSLVIPNHTLSQNYQLFFVQGTITNLNDGVAAIPLPAFPGISMRIAYIDSAPDTFPVGAIDKVLIDDCMLYMGTVDLPEFFPIPRAVDWARAEYTFEAGNLELLQLGMSTDLEYRLGQSQPWSTKKKGLPTISFDELEVTEDGSPFSQNDEASYSKIFLATDRNQWRAMVTKLIGGFRPSRMKTVVRAQS